MDLVIIHIGTETKCGMIGCGVLHLIDGLFLDMIDGDIITMVGIMDSMVMVGIITMVGIIGILGALI